MKPCPNCGESKKRLASHWRYCGYPMLSAKQRAVVRGLMLAGATVAGNGTNRYVVIQTVSEELAEWTANQLDWLCQSVGERTTAGDRENVYRVRTVAHPTLNRYERWHKLPENSGRAPPDDLVLERTTARVWWAYAGGLQWSGTYDSQVAGTFSAERVERAAWIQRVLADAGYNSTRAGKRVQLSPTNTQRWLNWIDKPAPGVEHKWMTNRTAYNLCQTFDPYKKRGEKRPSPEYSPTEVAKAIEGWAESTNSLTYESYHEYSVGDKDAPSVSWFYRYYPGFRDVASQILDEELPKVPGTEYWTRKQSAQALNSWIQTLATDEKPTTVAYREFESGKTDYPALSRIYELFDGWDDALNHAAEVDDDG